MPKKIIHHACGQEMETSCSCCGHESHPLSHPNCSYKPSRGCEEWWEYQEKHRLSQIEELKIPQRDRLDYMKEELANLKDYRDNKMANDTKTPQDIKDYICEYIVNLERGIAKGKPQTEAELEEINKERLKQTENYKREVYYSRPENRPPNTNCPHWRKYALNENNQPPTPPTNPQPSNNAPLSSYLVPVHSVNNPNETLSNQQAINLNLPKNKPTNEETGQNNDNSKSNSSEIPPSKNNNAKSFSVNSPNSPKTSSSIGIIVAIVIFAAFLIISLSYLVWKIAKK